MPHCIPVANNQGLAAAGTARGVTVAVVNIAGIDDLQSFAQPDPSSPRQCLGRRRRDVQHLVVGVKRREMQWHVGAEVVADPAHSAAISASLSFCPGMSNVVISTHTSVSFRRYMRVSSTSARCPTQTR